jgi:triosephosphate isomerase
MMSRRKKIIVGNWKMEPAKLIEAERIYSEIQAGISKFKRATAVICPPFIYIQRLAELGKKKIAIGAQNVFFEEKGAFTGEISVEMLKKLGVSHVIIGHSEQRKLGETDEVINKKVHIALRAGLIPIICLGEETRDEEGQYLNVIKFQLEHALIGVQRRSFGSIIIAYEPIWAIGAAEAMNSRDVHEMMIYIKKAFIDLYKIKSPISTPILYGGSVDALNAHGILHDGEADGLLIGRQSLSPESFIGIMRIASGL